MNIVATFGPKSELPLAMQPRQGPFHDPTVDPQSAAMLRAAPGQERLDPAATQPPTLGLRVIASVAIQPVGTAARPTRLAAHRRDRPGHGPPLRALLGGRRR